MTFAHALPLPFKGSFPCFRGGANKEFVYQKLTICIERDIISRSTCEETYFWGENLEGGGLN